MSETMNTQESQFAESIREWRRALSVIVTTYLLFETITGIWVHLAPFGVTAQVSLIAHTAIGVVLLPVYMWYQVKHWLRLRPKPVTHLKVVGYVLLAVLLVNLWTGIELTWDALFGRRISWTTDRIHLVTGYGAGVLLIVHLFFVARLHRITAVSAGEPALAQASTVHFRRAIVACLIGSLLIVGAGMMIPSGEAGEYSLPDDYSYRYGDNPFAPSLARTEHGGAIDPIHMARSRSCGTEGCHEQVLEEWLPSAHRYSAMDGAFQHIQKVMAENEGPEATRYCAGCHDPIALFSGSKNLYDEDLSSHGADEGISCIGCHAIKKADVQGNADYVFNVPERYIGEMSDGAVGKFVSDFLIRSYPRHHVASFKRDLYKTPEFCGACHKQFIDQRINKASWVQLQNQYDNWKASHWNQGDGPEDRLTCLECHMRLVDSIDPAAGDTADFNRSADDGKHRHHGFIGANQFIPAFHNLEGWQKHVELTEEWLRGDTEIPEIADRWRSGPVVPLKIMAPESVQPGEKFKLRVVIHSNKVGHDFPTGPLDIIQCWVQVDVKDADGKTLMAAGHVDDKGFLEEGAFLFKAEGIDREGNLIDRHNLWEMVGARFRRALFPDYTDTAEFQILCPSTSKGEKSKARLPEYEEHELALPEGVKGPLTVTAKLNYRKFNQFLVNYVLGDENARAPLTVMSEATADIAVIGAR